MTFTIDNVSYDNFFKTLTIHKSILQVEKLGILDATINATKIPLSTEIDFSLHEVLLFRNDDSKIIFHKKLNSFTHGLLSLGGISKITKLIQHLKNLSQQESFINIKNSQLSSGLSSRGMFHKISLPLIKQVGYFLVKNNLTLVGIFNDNTNSYLIKLYMLHVMTAFLNFIGEGSELINLNEGNFNSREIFQFKLFETYFISPISKHFEKITRKLFKKEEMTLPNIKFKNFYLIDLSSNEIICDLRSIRKGKKYKKINKNEKLWQELIHHSQNLMLQYKMENEMKCDMNNCHYNFIKLECTSTYPRLTFIIKFLPILKGVSMIHVYSQNKLSRMTDSESTTPNLKNYKEFEIIYGNEVVKSQNNIEFRYTEPKKLKEIERFLLEFYLNTNQRIDFFYLPMYELKYMNSFLLKTIDEVINHNPTSTYEQILAKINSRLHESYTNDNTKAQELLRNYTNAEEKSSLSHKVDSNNSDVGANMVINYNYMYLPKELILNEIFESKPITASNNNLVRSFIEDTPIRKGNEMSFDFVNQMSEISQLQIDYEGDKISNSYVGNNNMPYRNIITNDNDSISFDLTIIKNEGETISQKEKKSSVKIIDLSKLQKSIHNMQERRNSLLNYGRNLSPLIKNKISVDLGRKFSPASEIPRRKSQELRQTPGTPISSKISSTKENNILRVIENEMKSQNLQADQMKEEDDRKQTTEQNLGTNENAFFLRESQATFKPIEK